VAEALQASPNKECRPAAAEITALSKKIESGELNGEGMDKAGESVRHSTTEMAKKGFISEAQQVDRLVVAVGEAARTAIDVEVLEMEKQARAHISEARVMGESLSKTLETSGQSGAAHSVQKVLSHLQNASEGAFMIQVTTSAEMDQFNRSSFVSGLEEKLKVKRGRLHARAVKKYGDVMGNNKNKALGKAFVKSKDMEAGMREPSPAKRRANSPTKAQRAGSPERAGSPSKNRPQQPTLTSPENSSGRASAPMRGRAASANKPKFAMVKCGKETIGKKLEGSGSKRWKNVEEAKKQAEAAGHVLGVSCRYIQNAGGKVHWYAAGNECGESGTETWKFDPA